jgi:hypothetical protein
MLRVSLSVKFPIKYLVRYLGGMHLAECKLVKQEDLGDHVMFIGEVTEISADENVKPLVYHNGKYWRLDNNNKIPRPSQELLEKS